ncbi:hypothetical protein [Algoriphagus winogradskyi]|nr:hypothetical protein [Algoriphagus winogradskyi]
MLSSPGALLGVGSYKSKIQLKFDSTVPANTITYIRIDADQSLLQSLLGGSLGDLLSGVLSVVLLGEQEIIIEARSSSGSVMAENSSLLGFNNDLVWLVNDEFGNSYLAIRPDTAYDRILITNQSSSLLGGNTEYTLDVYHAFYFDSDLCDPQPTFTSFDGSGITLDAAGLNPLVESLSLAIDDDLETTFSEISLGVVGLAGTMEQKIYFNSPVQPGNEVLISMATGQSLLDLGLLNYVELVAYSNGVEVSTVSAASLLELDVLGLLASDEFFQFPISAGTSTIDAVGIRMASLVDLGALTGSLQISGATVKPIRPVIDTLPEEGFYEICYGQTVTVTPDNAAGGDLNWYRLESNNDETAIGIADAYTTPIDLAPGDHEFLVKSNGLSCAGESEPSRFKIKVKPVPTPANYSIEPSGELGIDEDGKYTYLEGVNPMTLKPSIKDLPTDGFFEWYVDEDMAIQITDGFVIDDVLFELDGADLTMTGLKFRDETDPYKFYLNWIPNEGCISDEPMELDLSSIARILNVSLERFDANLTSIGEVDLSWEFSKQPENKKVIIQRAGSNLDFREIWAKNLSEEVSNRYLDETPLKGESYYRLVLINENSEIEFTSDLRRVYNAHGLSNAYQVYPNQFENQFTIGTSYSESKEISYQLYSGKGSILRAGKARVSRQNTLRISNLESHPPGEYFLIIIDSSNKHAIHLIKN